MDETGEGATSATLGLPADRPPPRDPEAGRDTLSLEGGRIAQYELIRPLGRGGMGAVHLARDTRLGRLVAIKIVRDRELISAERFRVEARATARCVHENIVVIHDIGEHSGHLYMALEYLSGVTLKQWLEARRARAEASPLPLDRAVQIVLPVVRAMVCAHEHGIVHRDLKPSNIMMTDAGVIKVLDFGVAKLFGAGEPAGEGRVTHSSPDSSDDGAGEGEDAPGGRDLTEAGLQVGSGYYMSPEQRRAEDVDHRADLWAVGMILFELCAGRHPLRGPAWRNLAEVADLDVPMPRLAEARADAGKLGSIVDRCLIKRRSDRMGSARELCAELESLVPGATRARGQAADDVSPYAGLAAFQEGDADRFFGRTRDVAYAQVLLREQPFVAVVGPSGAGKSSFVRAGLVPALKHSGDAWEALVVRPGRHPLAALAALVIGDDSSSGSSGSDADRDALALRLAHEPGLAGAKLRARARRRLCRTLVFVDQFEELYTLGADPAERLAFATCLEAIADDATSPLRVVVTIRSDFLDRVTEDARLMNALVGGIMLLPPLAREGLEESLVRPLEPLGYRFESAELTRDMLDALEHTRGALPLLSFTAARLWEARDRGRRELTMASYRSIGGVAGTLASHADAVLASMSTGEQALARRLFERLVTPERTRAPVPLAELRALDGEQAEAAARVLARLVEARLLVVENDAEQGGTASIVHESLIDRWPTLAAWLDEHHEDAAFLARLRSAAREWKQSGEPQGLLWRDEAMLEARRWRRRSGAQVARHEAEFLAAVFALAEQSARRRRLAIGALVVGLCVVAAAMSSLAWQERHASRRARDEAVLAHAAADRAELEATRARDGARLASARELERDPTLALALLREVEEPERHRAWPTLAARVLRAPVAEAVLEGMDGIVWTAEFSPDGTHIATCAANTAYLWNADGTGAPLRLTGHSGPIWQAHYAPDGKHLLTSSWDGTVRIWNADGSGEPVVLRETDRISWAEWSPDSTRVVTGGWDNQVWVWRADGKTPPVILRGHTSRVRRVAFSPDGTRVASASFDGTARLWNADGSGRPVVLRGHTGPVWSIAFSPDGRRVATGAKDGTARLWNADGTGMTRVLPVDHPGVSSVTFSHDGRHLAITSWDQKARVWDVDDAARPPVVLVGHTGDVYQAAFSPDDRRLVTCSADKTARLWNSDGSGAPLVLSGADQGILYAAFSPDGERVVTAAGDASARVWRARLASEPVVLPGDPDDEARGAAFSPDGTHVVVYPDAGGSAHVWRADGQGAPVELAARCDRIVSAAFAPDGTHVAAGCDDGALLLAPADGSGPATVRRDARMRTILWIEYSRDGTRVLAGGDGGAMVYRADGQGEPVRLRDHGNVQFARFSPDATHVVLVASDDNSPEIWRADGQGAPLVLAGHSNIVHWAAFSPDGRLVVTASADNTARVWSADGQAPPVVLVGHGHEVRRATFSSDGRRVITACDDGTARVWNADGSGTPVVLRGHDEGIMQGYFDPTGTRVVTASDHVLRIWRADGTGVPIVIEGTPSGIQEAGFAPDGQHVWASTKDGRTWIWPHVDDIPTVAALVQSLWEKSSYCLPAERRRELVGVSEETARQELASCRARVVATRPSR